jgi:hypothetical protein
MTDFSVTATSFICTANGHRLLAIIGGDRRRLLSRNGRDRLAANTEIPGPALIEDPGSTLVIGPAATAMVMPSGSIVVELR